MLKKIGLAAAVFFFAAGMMGTSPSRADDCPEIADFADIDNIPVYAGACLLAAADDGFSRYQLPTGPMKGRNLSLSEPLEGLLQRRLYVAPAGVSADDLFENYRAALVKSEFEIVFECTARECGSSNALLGKLVIYPPHRKMVNLGKTSEFAMYVDGDEHFLAARSADGERHIALYVAKNQAGSIVGPAAGRAAAHLDVVTAQGLQANMIDAAALALGIAENGHVAVDNVYFALGTARLAPEAAPAITEMAKLLTDTPDLEVFIVGHTDWVGSAEANLALSEARAKAVVAALVEIGIAAERIKPAGVGMLAPKASNSTEAGRTLNRRVELVER